MDIQLTKQTRIEADYYVGNFAIGFGFDLYWQDHGTEKDESGNEIDMGWAIYSSLRLPFIYLEFNFLYKRT